MILLTGASGFLGQHLLQALVAGGMEVRALYHSSPPKVQYPGVEWYACDLLDAFAVSEAMKGITHVYHCAAIVSFDSREKNLLKHLNVTSTAHLVNAALEENVERFIHVSSVAALGRNPGSNGNGPLYISEENYFEEGSGNSAYAESKFLSEMEVWRAMAEGLDAAIVNPGIIIGEGDWSKGSAHLMQIVYDEFPWYTAGINAWVDVKDVVRALILLMNHSVTEQRYILSAGNFAYRDVFSLMAKSLNRKPPHRPANKLMTEIVWRMQVIKSRIAGKQATISKESARTAQTKCYYSNEKFLKDFPEFTYTPLEDTINRMAQSFSSRQA